ncbi:hypothetical protein ACJW30_05G138300 [Castanea mollissima]
MRIEEDLVIDVWMADSKAKAEKNQAMEHSMSEDYCQLCAAGKLTCEPLRPYILHSMWCLHQAKCNVLYHGCY